MECLDGGHYTENVFGLQRESHIFNHLVETVSEEDLKDSQRAMGGNSFLVCLSQWVQCHRCSLKFSSVFNF